MCEQNVINAAQTQQACRLEPSWSCSQHKNSGREYCLFQLLLFPAMKSWMFSVRWGRSLNADGVDVGIRWRFRSCWYFQRWERSQKVLDYATWVHAALTDGRLSSYFGAQDHDAVQRKHILFTLETPLTSVRMIKDDHTVYMYICHDATSCYSIYDKSLLVALVTVSW